MESKPLAISRRSGATGNMCVTISRKYTGLDGERRILCIDIKK
jgi:hypothetical protein